MSYYTGWTLGAASHGLEYTPDFVAVISHGVLSSFQIIEGTPCEPTFLALPSSPDFVAQPSLCEFLQEIGGREFLTRSEV